MTSSARSTSHSHSPRSSPFRPSRQFTRPTMALSTAINSSLPSKCYSACNCLAIQLAHAPADSSGHYFPELPEHGAERRVCGYVQLCQRWQYFYCYSDGFVPQQGYMVNPNMIRQTPQNYPTGYVQNFNGFQNQNTQQQQQFNNFRRQQ